MDQTDVRRSCQVVAKRDNLPSEKWQWIGPGPTMVNNLQRSRLVHPDDIGKFVLSVKFADSTHHRFYTPKTATDKIFWTNGLSGVETLAEGFALFATAGDACDAGHRFAWDESAVYEVVLTDPDTVAFEERLVATASDH